MKDSTKRIFYWLISITIFLTFTCGIYWLFKSFSYWLFYEDMVKQTIYDVVKSVALK